MDVMQNDKIKIKILILSLSCLFTIHAKEGYLAKVGSKPLNFDRPVSALSLVLARLPPLQKVTPDPRSLFSALSTNSTELSLAGLNVGGSVTNQMLNVGSQGKKVSRDSAHSEKNSTGSSPTDLSSGSPEFDDRLEAFPPDLSPQSLMPFFRPSNGKARKNISIGIPDFQPGRPLSEASSSATYERQ